MEDNSLFGRIDKDTFFYVDAKGKLNKFEGVEPYNFFEKIYAIA